MGDVRETIRKALNYAIQDRLSYLDAIKDSPSDDEWKQKTLADITEFRKVLKRRYGSPETSAEKGLKELPVVFVKEIVP